MRSGKTKRPLEADNAVVVVAAAVPAAAAGTGNEPDDGCRQPDHTPLKHRVSTTEEDCRGGVEGEAWREEADG